MDSKPSVGLARAWTFRIMLLVATLCGILGTANNTADRLALSMNGVPATITLARSSQKVPLPSDPGWLDGHYSYYVKVTTTDGKESYPTLFLSKQVIETIVEGGHAEIIFSKDNPGRFLMKGEPLPSFGFGWLIFGLAFFAIFLYSLRLK